MDKDKFDVFISYSRKDYVDKTKNVIPGNIVSKIKEIFKENDISFWFDEDGIYSGDAFAPVIARNIREAKVFLFISSKHSNTSEWTSDEVATAREFKKKIIPFRYDNSTYNEDIVLYLAKLDFITYTSNEDKALLKLVSAISDYKHELALKEEKEKSIKRLQEEDAKRLEEEQKRKERRQEEEAERKRIEAFVTEKRKKEERLNSLEVQILNIEESEAKLLAEKIEFEGKVKTIDSYLLSVRNKKTMIISQRDYQKAELVGFNNDEYVSGDENESKKKIEEIVAPSIKEPKREKGLIKSEIRQLVNQMLTKRYIIIGLVIVVLVLMGYFSRCGGTSEGGTTYVDSLIAVDSFAAESPFVPNEMLVSLSIVDKELDDVYGIETLDKLNWNNLCVLLKEDSVLHPVSFALLRATTGKNDYSGSDYDYNCTEARKNDIRIASYHFLNINPKWKTASGKIQAKNFISHADVEIGDLPPVLSVQGMNDEIKDIAITRCKEWLSVVEKHYGIKPILFVGEADYNDYFRELHLSNEVWIPAASKVSDKMRFQKKHYSQVIFYNGSNSHEFSSKDGRLSLFCGTHEEFVAYANDSTTFFQK